MRQLVELQKSYPKFKESKTEIIAVFREEEEGVEGLKKSKKNVKAEFHLWDDPKSKATKAYSQGSKFTTYVVDKEGVIRAVLDGNLRKRPLAAAVLAELAKLSK